ncbi:Primase-like protein [Vitis vinifera]|uniref:Primase-like protein n=1 Tax=Vitis vinifera TaxID=29760 RepID=A0A438IUU3_VITVI|nr:Primase-like protein [Vitis vinifera]
MNGFLPHFGLSGCCSSQSGNGVLVSCKYRDVNKNFWQEKDTEKIFYGVDDIKEASDIIIVEGEIDKLSMEEARFYNCVSVPDGAPPSVSTKVFESEEKMVCNVQCQRTLLMDPYQKEGLNKGYTRRVLSWRALIADG